MGDNPEQYEATMTSFYRQGRRQHRRYLLSTASPLSYRVTGRLDGRINVTAMSEEAKSEPWWWTPGP